MSQNLSDHTPLVENKYVSKMPVKYSMAWKHKQLQARGIWIPLFDIRFYGALLDQIVKDEREKDARENTTTNP